MSNADTKFEMSPAPPKDRFDSGEKKSDGTFDIGRDSSRNKFDMEDGNKIQTQSQPNVVDAKTIRGNEKRLQTELVGMEYESAKKQLTEKEGYSCLSEESVKKSIHKDGKEVNMDAKASEFVIRNEKHETLSHIRTVSYKEGDRDFFVVQDVRPLSTEELNRLNQDRSQFNDKLTVADEKASAPDHFIGVNTAEKSTDISSAELRSALDRDGYVKVKDASRYERPDKDGRPSGVFDTSSEIWIKATHDREGNINKYQAVRIDEDGHWDARTNRFSGGDSHAHFETVSKEHVESYCFGRPGGTEAAKFNYNGEVLSKDDPGYHEKCHIRLRGSA